MQRSAATRSPAPRFSLRSLLIFAVLFCLFFAWIGRGIYRVRQEDAAIERLKQTGATLWLPHDPKTLAAPEALPDLAPAPLSDRLVEMMQRAIGWSERPQVASVELLVDDPHSPDADAAIAALQYLPEVQSVTLAGAGFDDDSLAGLNELPRLKMLSIWETRATGEGLARIDRPERLRTLVICELDSEETKLLSGMSRLTEVRMLLVESPHVWREEVASIAALPRLESLTLKQPEPILEHALADLAQATGLRTLQVRSPAGIPFDPEGLETIAGLPHLEDLWIQALRDDDLPLLAGASKLKRLIVYEGASLEAAQEFSDSHPDCEVRLEECNGTWGVFVAGERTDQFTSEPVP